MLAEETYILLAGRFGPLASAARTECCKVLHLTLQFDRIKVQNVLHQFHERQG
jgi:hypothetical protein